MVDEIRSAGDYAVASTQDIASADPTTARRAGAEHAGGGSDAVVHDAAILRADHYENVSEADYDDIMHVNLRGAFRTVQAVYQAVKTAAAAAS